VGPTEIQIGSWILYLIDFGADPFVVDLGLTKRWQRCALPIPPRAQGIMPHYLLPDDKQSDNE
jgi:hypothetical protein